MENNWNCKCSMPVYTSYSVYHKGTARESKKIQRKLSYSRMVDPNCVDTYAGVCMHVCVSRICHLWKEKFWVNISFPFSKSFLSASSTHQLYFSLWFSSVLMFHLLAFHQSKTDLPHWRIKLLTIIRLSLVTKWYIIELHIRTILPSIPNIYGCCFESWLLP